MLRRYVKILHLLILCCAKVHAFECPNTEGYVWFPGARSCYLVQEMFPMAYKGANYWCIEVGGWLASLKTEQDFNEVVNNMNGSAYPEYWFGLAMSCQYSKSNMTNKNCWKWYEDSEQPSDTTWTKWDVGEPNDNNANELCGKIYFKTSSDPRWRNGDCDTAYPFICEKTGVELVHDVSSNGPNMPASSSSTLPTTVFMRHRNYSSTMITLMEPNGSQGIIIGCIVGAVALLAIVAVVVGVICYRRKKATKAPTERSSSLYYETQGQHLTANPDVPGQEQQGSAYENIAVVSNPPYTQPRPKSGTLNYVEVDFPNYTHNSPKPTPKFEQVEYAEVVVDKSDSKVPVARRVSDLYAKPMKRMKNALKKKEPSSEVQSGAYDNACNKGPTV